MALVLQQLTNYLDKTNSPGFDPDQQSLEQPSALKEYEAMQSLC